MAEDLRNCFPEIDFPDRPPDSSAPLNSWSELAVWDSRYKMWYPTPETPGIALTTEWGDHFSDHEPFEDTTDLHWLGQQGLKPMLEYVGMHTYTYGGTEESPAIAAALVFPTTEQFCSRFNQLLDLEHPRQGPPLRLVPYTEPEPVYSLSTLEAYLDAGSFPISNKAPQDSHDQLHAVALYGVIDQLPETPSRLAEEFEAILSLGALVGIMTSPEINDYQSWADSIWRRILGLNNTKDVNAVFRRIQERIDSTPQHLARLAVDSSS